MKLIFMYYPVRDLETSLEFYREKLGFDEAWREGTDTAALKLPGSDVQLLLESDEDDHSKPGGVFQVESVDAFFKDNKGILTFVKKPVDIPPGRYAIYEDNAGNPIRIIDFSAEKAGV
ncbi:VOC family protein [Alteribacter natronophilus]|uniref:VOC family protein n=1 Tax=Alteribacter natronophilus TaxID=2583810 RepID=UPI00110F59A3|nr:VOC family protein [Alteribacter natronophilus]TMW70360.1 hypothetical protein FGB90_16950 [Alteribacter natronophilus]